MKLLIFLISVLLLIHASIVTGFAGEPMDTIEAHVRKALSATEDDPSRKEKTIGIINEMFDFSVVSRFALGKHWGRFSQPQKKEFIGLFKIVLENFYSDKLFTYAGEGVSFTREKILSDKRADVQSRIQSDKRPLSVLYRMIWRHGRWKVFDVVIQGVSLARNYRSQFQTLLKRESPEAIINILRGKTARYRK